MNMNKGQSLRMSGHVLAVVVSIIAIVTLMSLSLLSVGLNSRVFATRTTQKITARCAADAGLTKALFEMNEKLKVKPWDDFGLPQSTDETLPNCAALFSYVVTGKAGGVYTIESVGKAAAIEKQISADLGLQGLFEHAILVKDSTTLKSGTVIDGYNSKDPADTDIELKIGTLSTLADQIILNASVTVNGAVVVGVDGDINTVIKDLGAATGDRYAMTEEPPLPKVTPPALPDMSTDIDIKGETLILSPDQSGKYTDIQIKKTSSLGILEISGGDVVLHITGDIEVGQECEINVKSGASLRLYVDGDIHCRADSGIGSESFSFPQTFQLYATGAGEQEFDIKAKSDWCGVVYAPNANIILYANGNCYGSIVADDFEYKAGGNFYYDAALREVRADDDYVRFVVKRWREK
ncbi:MAG: hypothetical protein AMJ79_11910 [Phycisphaerae bacterium SM23_30]|nr:MAG: hypothetical protein AMJ79_11910 [Phycisphaerae bacterium SM23_30]